jgi:hypothetical protein
MVTPADAVRSGPPVNLLESTFVPLAGGLMSADAWRPMPKFADRMAWMAVPQDVRDVLVQRAEAVNNDAWPIMLATEELEFNRNGNRTRFEAITFGRRGRLSDLVLGECIAGEGKYLDQIANGIWLICEESFWGVPAHLGAQKAGVGLADEAEPIIELFGAETAATLAWVVYLLNEQLGNVSKLLVPRIQMETKRRILDVYLERSQFGWMGLGGGGHVNNWNPWINSNVLTATMVLEPDVQRRVQLVAKVCKSVDVFLAEYSPDAGCEEGPVYWSRSAASFFDCCTTLVSAHGGKGSAVLTHPFTRAMGRYIADVHIAKNLYVNYGDAHVDSPPEPELMYCYGKASGDAMLADFGAFDAGWRGSAAGGAALSQAFSNSGGGPVSLSRELAKVFVTAEVRTAPKHDALVRDAWYPHLGLMAARQTEGSSDGFYVALQAASNGRSHGHNDSGSFIVFQGGEPVFIDVGVEAYTAKTFSKERYDIWTMQSAFHNLPTIGGVMQHDGNTYQASEVKYEKSDARTSVRANLATAYPKEAGVKRWMRTVMLDRTARRVEFVEEFALGEAVPVELSLMTAREPVIAAGSVKIGSAVLALDAGQLAATSEKIVLTDASLKHSWGDAVWRVKLTSKAVESGSWKMTLSAG